MAHHNATLRPHPDVIAKRLAQATVLVHIPSSRIFELNETGTVVWELLGQGMQVDVIVHQLIQQFDVNEETAANEVQDMIAQLVSEGLLVE